MNKKLAIIIGCIVGFISLFYTTSLIQKKIEREEMIRQAYPRYYLTFEKTNKRWWRVYPSYVGDNCIGASGFDIETTWGDNILTLDSYEKKVWLKCNSKDNCFEISLCPKVRYER